MKRFILLVVLVLLIAGCSNHEQDVNEKKFKMIATEYYEKELKGKVIGVTEYTITLKGLKLRGYDVSSIVNSEGKECDETSSIVITEKDNSYEMKVNLICN